jgi:GNAT superfamily N-acetyltransferase
MTEVDHGSGDGVEVECTITYLEMTARPTGPIAPLPMNAPVCLMRAVEPPLRWFFHLYDGVGEQHDWTDRHRDDPADLLAFLHDPNVSLFCLMHDGWAGGLFMLDHRDPGVCDLAYFGIAPELLGRGYGKWLLGEAIQTGWDRDGTTRMTLNTNTLDHPRALPLYQRMGFVPVRREVHRRIGPAA